MGVDGLVIALAAAAAVLFAVANNLQRGAASAVPLDAGGPVRLILRLMRTPHWVVGSLVAVAALGLHAAALVASVVGNVIVQRAYQRAPLRVVLPAVTAAGPLASFLIGRLLLGERFSPGTAALSAARLGISAVVVGVVVTTTMASGGLQVAEGSSSR
jgi:hypothetical protein